MKNKIKYEGILIQAKIEAMNKALIELMDKLIEDREEAIN